MATKEQIIEAVETLFMERGCKSVTMDDIALENGISKRTLYEIFADKTTLLEESIIYYNHKKKEVMSRINNDPESVLSAFIDAVVKEEGEDFQFVNLHHNFFQDVKKHYPELFSKVVRRISNDQYEMVYEFFEKGKKQGCFLERLDSRMMSIALMQFSGQINQPYVYNALNIPPRMVLRDVMLHVMRGFSTERGIALIDEFYSNNNNK